MVWGGGHSFIHATSGKSCIRSPPPPTPFRTFQGRGLQSGRVKEKQQERIDIEREEKCGVNKRERRNGGIKGIRKENRERKTALCRPSSYRIVL